MPEHGSPAVELRAARRPDVDEIARIWWEGWFDGHLGHVPDSLVAHRTLVEFARRAVDRLPITTVGIDAHGVAGFVVAADDEVEQLYVPVRARGLGVASALLCRAEQVIAERFEVAWLAVVQGNVRARRFYERCGWRDSGAIDNAAEISGGVMLVPARRYEKPVRIPPLRGVA